MIGSNEADWRLYQSEPVHQTKKLYNAGQANNARRIHSGIDPEESFNTFRGGLWAVVFTLVIIGIVCCVWL